MFIHLYLIAVTSFLGAIYLAWEHRQGYACHKWPSTKGVIIQSNLATYRNSKTMKTPSISYTFTVNDKEYYSRRLALYITKPLNNKEADELHQRYPVDKEVIVKYHPLFHSFAVLETGPRQVAIRVYLFLILLLFFSISAMAIYMPDIILIFEAIRYFNA